MVQRQISFTLCIFINLAALLFYVSAHTQEFNNARIQTLPAYVIATKADLLNSTICGKELQNFRDAADQQILWSLKVLDSSGRFESGFLYGNNYWLGSRSHCLDTMNTSPLQISERKTLHDTLYRDPQKEFPPFQINYFVAHFRHNSTLQYKVHMLGEDVITLGFCLPASCTINDLSFILEKMFRERIVLIDDLYSVDFQLIQVKDLKDDNKWLSYLAFRFICVALAFSLSMTITGTIYDIFVYQKHVKKNKKNETNQLTGNVENNEIKTEINSSSHRESKIGKVLICFSAYTNTRKIFSMKLDARRIPAIDGLKFLSVCWIIVSHSILYVDSMDNKVWFFKFMARHTYMFDAGILSVDVLFFSSGCLVTYLYLRDKTNKRLNKPTDYREKLIELLGHIIKRFIRLTPTYMMVLGISQLISAWFDKTSQFYVLERLHETCPKYWWRNLLYINNFFGFREMCMTWSWHLSNEMQFFIIAMMVLILSTIYFYAAVTILIALLTGSVIISGYISYVNEYVPTMDGVFILIDVLYFPPWTRINSYIIGIISGYILIKLDNNLVLRKKHTILCWCLASACSIYVSFAVSERFVSVLAASIYVAFHRILWTISIGWVVIACSTRHGGIINPFLSFKGWIPLSKLTYGACLLNPIIVRSISLYSETAMHMEFLPVIIMNVGYITIVYFCAYLLSLMVEIPYISLMQMFIHYRNRVHRKVL